MGPNIDKDIGVTILETEHHRHELHFCTSSAEKYIYDLIINQFSPFQVRLVFNKDVMYAYASYWTEFPPTIASVDIDRQMGRGVFL